MKTLKTITVLFALILITACGSKDDGPSKPSISYENKDIEAVFQQAGSTMPAIDWNGNTGTLELIESYSGGIPNLTINGITGEITWTNLLGEGNWIFDVQAANSAGTTTLEMSIDNTLQGSFVGTYSTTEYFKVEFFKDHSVLISLAEGAEPGATGTWTISNAGVVTVNYTYGNGTEYSIKGDLTRTNDSAVFSGNWYYEFDANPDNVQGPFSVSLE